MRVLFLNQFFLPDGAATAQLLGDLVAGSDEEIEVICGDSGYVSGAADESRRPNVTVRRVPSPGFSHGKLRKLWSYAGFYASALVAALRGRKPDIVVTMTTPPLLGLIGWAMQALRGSRHFIWEMDVYPDIATELGVFRRGGWTERIVGLLADLPRRRADGVIALGPCMATRLESRGVPAERIHICHNWANGASLAPLPFHPNGKLKVLYSGNFGLAHDFDTVVEALRVVGADARFEFLFSGGGPHWKQLRSICEERGYTSCRFQGFQPREGLSDLLGWCDVGLVTQHDRTQGAVVPSKTYGLMAAGRGVIYVGPSDATPGVLIDEHRIGWRVANGGASELVALLQLLAGEPYLYERVGRQSRQTFESEYDLPVGVRRVLYVLGAAEARAVEAVG